MTKESSKDLPRRTPGLESDIRLTHAVIPARFERGSCVAKSSLLRFDRDHRN
jgi:hypothetical protein